MKFQFIISKWANFYFFVSNLSEWHFSARKNYNLTWKEGFGGLSTEEENALNKFKEFRQGYNSGKTFFEEAFFTTKNPFDILQKNLPESEYQIIKQVFNILEKKFDILYDKDLSLMKEWRKKLINEMSDYSMDRIINILEKLYNTSTPKKEINIYILFSASQQTGGGSNINDKSITIELSHYPLEKINHILGIIWHEVIHLIYQDNFYKLLLIYSLADQKVADFINELVATSLFPKGILGIRLLNANPAIKLLSQITETQTINIINLTKIYIDQNESFDNDFIKKLDIIIKNH